MKYCYYAIVCVAIVAESAFTQEAVQLIGELKHGPMKEVSGITRSSYDGVFWVHNDSGDIARIFAITLDGKPVIPPFLKRSYVKREWPGLKILNAWNVDWEDIAYANGRIYIADMGNNGNKHRKRGEIIGWESGTKLFRLDYESTTQENILTLIGQRLDLTTVTAADMSPDGKRLAILSYSAVWVFERPKDDDNWLTGSALRLVLDRKQMGWNEAITWQNDETLLIANENRMMFKVRTSSLSTVDEQ